MFPSTKLVGSSLKQELSVCVCVCVSGDGIRREATPKLSGWGVRGLTWLSDGHICVTWSSQLLKVLCSQSLFWSLVWWNQQIKENVMALSIKE